MRLLPLLALLGCTDETPYVIIDEPTDLARSTGAVYRLQDVESCGDPTLDTFDPNAAFLRVTVDNLLDEPILAMTWSPDPCAPFDDQSMEPGDFVELAYYRGGTLRIYDEDLEPLHTWLVVGPGGVTVQ